MATPRSAEFQPALSDPLRLLFREVEEILPARRLLARVRLQDLGFAGRSIIDLAVLDRGFHPELLILLDASRSRVRAVEQSIGDLPLIVITQNELRSDPVNQLHRPLSAVAKRLSAVSLKEELLDAGLEVPLRSGIEDLDRLMGSFKAGQLCIVGGAEGCGKSSFLRHLALENAVRRSQPTTFVSLESAADALAFDLAGALTGIASVRLAEKSLTPAESRKLTETADWLADAPLTIVAEPDLTISLLEGVATTMAGKEPPPRLVLLDCLELLKTPSLPESLVRLKQMARRLSIALVVATNRLTLKEIARSDKRPTLHDLGEPGRHADKVLLLHREKVYEMRSDNAYLTEIHLVKNRGGPKGMASIAYFEESQRFTDLEVSYEAS